MLVVAHLLGLAGGGGGLPGRRLWVDAEEGSGVRGGGQRLQLVHNT